MNNLKNYIASVTAFSEQSWEILLPCMTQKEFQRNEILLEAGQISNSVFYISSGLCKACVNQDGKEINTEFYFENDFASNIKSLTQSAKSDYFIKAVEKSVVVQFDKTKLLEAYSQSQQIESFGRKILEICMAKHEEHANNFKLLTPRQRFENLVTKRPDFLQRVSLTQTASYLGISRETLSRLRAVK